MEEYEIIFNQARNAMGFVPNTLLGMQKKPNIMGAFGMFMANIRGFSSSNTTPLMGIRLMLKNMRLMIQAKKERDQELPVYLKDLLGHVASNAAGCRYCQAHTAYTAYGNGVSVEKLQNVWEFQTSDLFSAKEKAALSFALAAASVPNQVTPEHHKSLKQFFTESQIVEIMATVAVFGFLNRWNDSMATELEDTPLQFAEQHLSATWEPGKHKSMSG